MSVYSEIYDYNFPTDSQIVCFLEKKKIPCYVKQFKGSVVKKYFLPQFVKIIQVILP